MSLIDISPLVHDGIDVWPGDVPFRARKSLEIKHGANLDLGAMETTFHVGAHADAANHYVEDGADAASMPLGHYYGPCQVIEVDVGRGRRIFPRDLPCTVEAPRVLLKTGTFPDPDAWNDDFAALSPEVVGQLAVQDVVLVGIDTPSVDPFDDKELLSHKALHEHGMANLEGLVLDHVRPGLYTLIALPLRIRGADASPVRAVLVP